MAFEDILGAVWDAITSSLLCTLLTLGLVVLFIIFIFLWRIHKIRSEDAWIHQPLFFKRRRGP